MKEILNNIVKKLKDEECNDLSFELVHGKSIKKRIKYYPGIEVCNIIYEDYYYVLVNKTKNNKNNYDILVLGEKYFAEKLFNSLWNIYSKELYKVKE